VPSPTDLCPSRPREIAVAEKEVGEAADYISRARAAAPNDPTAGLMLVNMYGCRRTGSMPYRPLRSSSQFRITRCSRVQAECRPEPAMRMCASTYRHAHELAPRVQPDPIALPRTVKAAKKFPEARSTLQAALDRDPVTHL